VEWTLSRGPGGLDGKAGPIAIGPTLGQRGKVPHASGGFGWTGHSRRSGDSQHSIEGPDIDQSDYRARKLGLGRLTADSERRRLALAEAAALRVLKNGGERAPRWQDTHSGALMEAIPCGASDSSHSRIFRS
jgi:hypothetical protein